MHKKNKMIALLVVISLILAHISWKIFVGNEHENSANIIPSNNISYKNVEPQAITSKFVIDQFNQKDGSPILIYFYTTWCSACTKNFNVINEIAREFQNSKLKVIAIATDKDISYEKIAQYFSDKNEVYFKINYLISEKIQLLDFLNSKGIKYEGRIPFTALVDQNQQLVIKYSGYKNIRYLRNKIITVLQ